jgi:hypothetical protein
MRGNDAFWYLLGVLIIIGGLVAGIVGAIHDVGRLVEAVGHVARFVVPGSENVTISKPGTYVLYYEYKSVLDGEIFSTSQETDVKCTATRFRTGEDVPIEPVRLTAQYEINGRAGKAIAQFTATDSGTYILSCAHPDNAGPRIVLAVAPPLTGDWLVSMFKWLAIVFGSFALGLVILIVTLVRRAATLTRPVLPS